MVAWSWPCHCYSRVAGGESVCSTCDQRLTGRLGGQFDCKRCLDTLCLKCFAGESASTQLLTFLTCGLWQSSYCTACVARLGREATFDTKLAPRLIEGCTLTNEDRQVPGWLTLSADLSDLKWTSLEQKLNRPRYADTICVGDITQVEGPADGVALTIRISTADATGSAVGLGSMGRAIGGVGNWLQGKGCASLCVKAADEREFKQWLLALTELMAIETPRQAEKKMRAAGGAKRKQAAQARLETRAADRQRRLEKLGNVGMKFTAQALARSR